MSPSAACPFFLCVALAGCGGGGEDSAGLFTVDIVQLDSTGKTVYLSGRAFVPQDAICVFHPRETFFLNTPASCNCTVGTQASGQWRNSATGASGPLKLMIRGDPSCVPIVWWGAGTAGIELAVGDNPISLFLSDGVTQGAATVSVAGR